MTEAPSAPKPAGGSSYSIGCLLMILAMVALLAGGCIWNAVTGNDSSPTRNVSRYSYTGTWPLTVDSATIGCDGNNPWVRLGATFYALDGAGKMAGYSDIDPIWAYDTNGDGLKVDISGLRAQASALC